MPDAEARALALRLLQARTDGAFALPVRLRPGAGRDAVIGAHGDRLKVQVAAPPEKGKANLALCRLVADLLGLRLVDVEIVRGHGSRDKLLQVRRSGPG